MIIILFDTPQTHQSLYPLTLTRPVAALRLGIFTRQQWWQQVTGVPVYALAEAYLALPAIPQNESYLYIEAAFLPAPGDVEKLQALQNEEACFCKERLIAVKTQQPLVYPVGIKQINGLQKQEWPEAGFIQFPWQLFQKNAAAIAMDYELITNGRISQPIDSNNVITGAQHVFTEPGAVVNGCFINALEGPVYIGKDALVMEGACLRGPVAIGNNAVVKMGAKLYGGTTVGPWCTAGGEIKNAMMMGYCNKAHDGYLGDAVIGEWCNLGAGTTNSNVKNTGGEVKMWSEAAQAFVPAGKKAGLIMGDYSRSAINTGFNTGTVIGVCSNIFGNRQPPKHVPSFAWGADNYLFEKALADINNWKQFKGKSLEEGEKQMLNELYRSQLPAIEI